MQKNHRVWFGNPICEYEQDYPILAPATMNEFSMQPSADGKHPAFQLLVVCNDTSGDDLFAKLTRDYKIFERLEAIFNDQVYVYHNKETKPIWSFIRSTGRTTTTLGRSSGMVRLVHFATIPPAFARAMSLRRRLRGAESEYSVSRSSYHAGPIESPEHDTTEAAANQPLTRYGQLAARRGLHEYPLQAHHDLHRSSAPEWKH